MPTGSQKFYYATGKRKNSVARVFLRMGKGEITVNKKSADKFFGRDTDLMVIRQPLELTDNTETFSVTATVKGGGTTGQANAIRHGIAKALTIFNEENRKVLRQNSLLTRDSRIVERKKVGLHKARKRPQFSKR